MPVGNGTSPHCQLLLGPQLPPPGYTLIANRYFSPLQNETKTVPVVLTLMDVFDGGMFNQTVSDTSVPFESRATEREFEALRYAT